ncbi:hypothetical protein MBLNU459_g7892t1 [Dothideomycetes sp. NU459]
MWLSSIALVGMMASRAVADTLLSASNTTSSAVATTTPIDIALKNSTNSLVVFDQVQPLIDSAVSMLPAYGLNGRLFAANPSNMNNLTSELIAYISCDEADYPGLLQPVEVVNTALTANVTAILLYSRVSSYCNIGLVGSAYPFIYSMIRANSSKALLNDINTSTAVGSITFADEINKSSSSSNSSSSSTTQSNPLGASPTTAVAMIILYSITGIITALFLVIIVTGAIRAHRHPERYGPRNILGRPRQSRAKGLARAMLDTIPIVKFGDTAESAKPTDVELAENEGSSVTEPTTVIAGQKAAEDEAAHSGTMAEPRSSTQSARSGINPAATTTHAPIETQNDEALVCSICTDDFETGQDLRVLPCDHKFHPACIDPWLLNVSGTCPLCRIDLNPQHAEPEAVDGQTQGEGEAAERTTELPPPLQGPVSVTRITMRRSLLVGLGMGRTQDVSNRERRLAAVRRVRDQQAAAAAAAAAAAGGQAPEAEGEGRRRRRFRERFGIRTTTNNNATAAATADARGRTGDDGAEAASTTAAVAPEQAPEPLPTRREE